MRNRKMIRLKGFDYRTCGCYFVTIVCENFEYYFGNIVNHKIVLNKLGSFCHKCIPKIKNHYPLVDINEYIVMPNHIHMIVCIKDRKTDKNTLPNGKNNIVYIKPIQNIIQQNQIQPTSGSLGAIIRGFKIGVTKFAKLNNITFKRHGRFYDSIIKNPKAYNNITNYIRNNPTNWKKDKFSRSVG